GRRSSCPRLHRLELPREELEELEELVPRRLDEEVPAADEQELERPFRMAAPLRELVLRDPLVAQASDGRERAGERRLRVVVVELEEREVGAERRLEQPQELRLGEHDVRRP